MRQLLLRPGAEELNYEIRGIVKKARQIEALGYSMTLGKYRRSYPKA